MTSGAITLQLAPCSPCHWCPEQEGGVYSGEGAGRTLTLPGPAASSRLEACFIYCTCLSCQKG